MKYKKGLMLFMIVILLTGTAVLPGCKPPAEVNKLVIPSSLMPVEVFKEVAINDSYSEILPLFDGKWSAEHTDPADMPQGATMEQFTGGYLAIVPEVTYTMRNGERAGWGYVRLVLHIVILKYETESDAERSFINISKTQQLQNLTYDGIALKNGTHTLTWVEEEGEGDYWDNSTISCYLIHSGCFVIYYYGREDILSDMLDRIIVAFGVKE